MQTKSAKMSNLIFFKVLLRLVICELENSINFVLLSLLIEIMTCFLDSSFVVMFSFGFSLLLSEFKMVSSKYFIFLFSFLFYFPLFSILET